MTSTYGLLSAFGPHLYHIKHSCSPAGSRVGAGSFYGFEHLPTSLASLSHVFPSGEAHHNNHVQNCRYLLLIERSCLMRNGRIRQLTVLKLFWVSYSQMQPHVFLQVIRQLSILA